MDERARMNRTRGRGAGAGLALQDSRGDAVGNLAVAERERPLVVIVDD